MNGAVSFECVCVWLDLYTTALYVLNVKGRPPVRYKNVTVCLCVDGSDSRDKPKLYRLQHSITEVGSDCTEDGAIQVTGRRHYHGYIRIQLEDIKD